MYCQLIAHHWRGSAKGTKKSLDAQAPKVCTTHQGGEEEQEFARRIELDDAAHRPWWALCIASLLLVPLKRNTMRHRLSVGSRHLLRALCVASLVTLALPAAAQTRSSWCAGGKPVKFAGLTWES